MTDRKLDSLIKLKKYCETEGFKGYDPYDGLNSVLFQSLHFLSNNRLARLAWIQLFKRLPFNLRPIVGISKDFNPKALGLFLSGYCNLYKKNPTQKTLDYINFFSTKLIELANVNYSGMCWGYNFDWQAKAFFQPKNTPTVVATTFISDALLSAYEITNNDQLLKVARSSCDFIRNDLNRTYDKNGNFAFSYSPLDNTVVFNASLLGSRVLARVYDFTHEKELIDDAKKSVAFCCDFQRDDGSWSYGTLSFHQWIDNFHTGYNLECISDYMKYSKDLSYKNILQKGLLYYTDTFFSGEGVSKYYNNSTYPIDIHAPAQLVITLSKLGRFNEYRGLIDKTLDWTITNMQSKNGYFYFQKNRYSTSKISYMRWSQAWMFYALSEYQMQIKDNI